MRGLESWENNDDLKGFLNIFGPRFGLLHWVLKVKVDKAGRYGNLGLQRMSSMMGTAILGDGAMWFLI